MVLIVQVMQVRVKLWAIGISMEDLTKRDASPGQVIRELIRVLFFCFSGGVSCIFLTDISTAGKCFSP